MKQNASALPAAVVHEVRDHCLCFATQRAARLLARRFDEVFLPLGINNGQYSLMVALSSPRAWRIGALADFLAMDRTTLTAALATLVRRKLIKLTADAHDKRATRPVLTKAGERIVVRAAPLWRAEHRRLDHAMGGSVAKDLRAGLGLLSGTSVN